MDRRKERLAKNEIFLREVNNRIEDAAHALTFDNHLFEFMCECSNPDCTLRVQLTIAQYEDVRRDSTQFIVAPGHELPEIEDAVARGAGYEVVRKHGAAAALAERRDRRADTDE